MRPFIVDTRLPAASAAGTKRSIAATSPAVVTKNGIRTSTATARAAAGASASQVSQVSQATPPHARGCAAARGTT